MQARLKHADASRSGIAFGGLWTTVIVGQIALTCLFLMSAAALGWSADGPPEWSRA